MALEDSNKEDAEKEYEEAEVEYQEEMLSVIEVIKREKEKTRSSKQN